MIESYKTVFSKVLVFPHFIQSVLLVLLQGCFKKADIQFKHNDVLHNEDKSNEGKEYETLKVFHPTPEHKVKSHPCLSNEWLHKHTIIMIYYCFHYKFESNHTKWGVLTSSELLNKIQTVLNICTRTIQGLWSM